MKLLHIGRVLNNGYSGEEVATREHVLAMQEIEETALLNLSSTTVPGIKKQYQYDNYKKINRLPFPFCKPDLVIFHGIYKFSYLKISLELIRENIPYIIIPHGSLTEGAQANKRIYRSIANFLVFNHFIRNAISVQFLNMEERDVSIFNDKYLISPNGVNSLVLPNTYRKDMKKGFRFTYIGRLDIECKGIDLVVDVVKDCENELRNKEIKVFLYGPNYKSRHNEINKLITDRRLSDIIHLYDGVFGVEKENVLRETSIFFQFSRHEGLPLGLLEALNYGIPCFVTKETNLGSMIVAQNAGWSADADRKALRNKLKQVISELDQISVKSQNAKKLINENYEWKIVTKRVLEQYKILLSNFYRE